MNIHLHHDDLPDGLDLGDLVAVDTETLGLNLQRDRLCLVQLSAGDGECHLVKFSKGNYDAPNLKALLGDEKITKIFHFARFDVAIISQYLGVICAPLFCTKIASKLVRTYTDRHSLREVCREIAGVELNKMQQSSDWGADELSQDQQKYAASDVLYLHEIKAGLEEMLVREGRMDVAQACFDFLPHRAALDLMGWNDNDIFSHH